MVLVARKLGWSKLSITRTFLTGIASTWLERIYVQWFCYTQVHRAEDANNRVFFKHWGPSADSGHWLIQLETNVVHIFKENGITKADLRRPPPNARAYEVPPLSKSVYIPFTQ
jgi:hypothetical protein